MVKQTRYTRSVYHKANRLITMVSMCLFFFFTLCTNASAAGEESSYLAEMNDRFWSWFLMIRNFIAFPLLAVSYASCGFRVLSASFKSRGDQAIDSVKSQIIVSTLALIVLICLPMIMGEAQDMLKGSAWTPPSLPPLPTEPPA